MSSVGAWLWGFAAKHFLSQVARKGEWLLAMVRPRQTAHFMQEFK
jgi:hypothetical protein